MKDLKEFPEEGYCESTDLRLINYLKSRENVKEEAIRSNAKGVAWNKTSYWSIISSTSKQEYSLEPLLKFIEKEWIPQVGEWVKVLKQDDFPQYVNKVYQVIVNHSATPKGLINIKTGNNADKGFNINPENVCKALPHEIPNQEEDLSKVPYTEWEVGDTVERTTGSHFEMKRGDTDVIVYISGGTVKLFKDSTKDKGIMHSADNLKLVKRASNQSEDTFVLPEKWYVQATKENRKTLENWKCGGFSGEPETIVLLSDKYFINNSIILKEFKKITFEQFQKYVLKQSSVSVGTGITDQINKLINKQENVNTKQSSSKESKSEKTDSSSCQGIKIRRSNLNVSEGIGIRGSSIKSSRSKIHVGSNNSYN